jgi:hypothetical protein
VVNPRSVRRAAASSRLIALRVCLAAGIAIAGGCSERAAEGPAAVAEPEPSPPPAAVVAAGPSIIVINIDTLRRDHLSLYGYERTTSPQLEALAAESIVFEHAVSTSSST